MIKINFVCWGNICRSPMAEFVLMKMVEERGLSDQFYICSTAISSEEIWNGVGNPVYPPAREELSRHGISCAGKRATQLVKSDYDKYDYIIGMESMNLRYINRICGHDVDKKVSKLMDFTNEGGNIGDPWYSGDFRGVYRQIERGCAGLLEHLERTGEIWK